MKEIINDLTVEDINEMLQNINEDDEVREL